MGTKDKPGRKVTPKSFSKKGFGRISRPANFNYDTISTTHCKINI